MDQEAYITKAESLADKMNKITEKLDLSEDLLVTGDELVEVVQGSTREIELLREEGTYADIMNLEIMTEDFKYVRETLKDVTENARKVINSLTLDLLSEEGDARAALIVSFAELSKSITDAQKLYVQSYKDMSTTLLNLDKIKKAVKADEGEKGPQTVNNNLHVHTTETISTADLLNKMRNI